MQSGLKVQRKLGRGAPFLISGLREKLCKEGTERKHGDSLGELRVPHLGGAEALEDPRSHTDDLGLYPETHLGF